MAGFRDKLQRLIRPPDDEYEEYYEEDEPEEPARYENEEPRRPISLASYAGRNDRVTRLPESSPKSGNQVSVYKPTSFGEDTRAIADDLIQRHTVVLILERADKETSRRIVDFLSGVAYANRGTLKPVAANMVIITPYNVDLSIQDLLDDLDTGSSMYF